MAVEELGYVRNRAMRSMVGGATGSIGLVIPTIDNAIFSEMLQTFSSAPATRGRTMLIAAHGYDLAREAVPVRSLSEQRVDALALIGLEHRPETLAQIDRQGVPAAVLWNYRPGGDWPCIGFDNELAGRMAAEYLLALGHRDILFATGEERSNDRAAGRRKGAMFAAASRGIAVPDDLSIIGIGDFRGSDAFEPGLTAVHIPARRIGRLAADALVETIDWPDADFHHEHCCPLEPIVRGTCKAPGRLLGSAPGRNA